jgi:hypothetical protein
MAKKGNETAVKKLKILFTVVDRNKGEFYLDVLSQFDVNFQTVINGTGTAKSEILDMLGLNNNKAVIISVIREDMTDTIMKVLEEKFRTIRNGKGVAFAVPMSSVIGVNIYRFLSNNQM